MSLIYKNNGPIDPTIPPDLSRLKGKSVIITGGSSGLGAAYVDSFLSHSAYVTNADIQSRTLPPSLEEKHQSNYQYLKCDVRSWSDQLTVFKAAMTNSPGRNVDIVVANAGITGKDPIWTMDESEDPEEPDLRIIDICLRGVLYTTKLSLHYFTKCTTSDKCLILKSSLAGYLDLPGATSYQCAKYAVRGLMCNLRNSGFCRVNVIAPWFIATPIMSEQVIEILGKNLKDKNSDWAEVEDSAKAVIRVAADETINGRTIAIVPRLERKEGYMDMGFDDYPAGSDQERWQTMILGLTHRTLPQEVQSRNKEVEE
ncbi:NAD(P)-binding protein [Tothia fuscella]|uniref:NAD(P)-binding protein n=1 Tax=Tothia fuscella TaxID=1048955 RepID=A0A9P4NHG4_9PEZI|nr:NAD(P)-binding protein [Tothia fuscella]